MVGSPKKYRPIPHYPSTTRDIALLVDEHVTYKQVYDIMKDSPLVTEVTLFDLYSGEQTAGKKSLAFRIVYQSPGHTLTDDEVNKVQEQLLHRLFQKLGASLRA